MQHHRKLFIFIVALCFLLQGSRDNMSIEIVTFPGAPAVCEEAVKKEAELDARIETLVKGSLIFLVIYPMYCGDCIDFVVTIKPLTVM